MTAYEFLESKGLNSDGLYTHIPTAELGLLLDEYHAIASGQKINLDKKFENLTEKHLAEQAKKHE